MAFVVLYSRQKRQQLNLKQIRMHEACQKNAGVYIGTTISLETAQLESDGSFESSGSSEHIYTSVGSFSFLPPEIQEDDSGYLKPVGYSDTIITKL